MRGASLARGGSSPCSRHQLDPPACRRPESPLLKRLLHPRRSGRQRRFARLTFLKSDKSEPIFGERGSDAIYAFLGFRAPVSKSGRIYTPLIIPPVYLKNFEKPVFRVLWNNCTAALSTAKK